MQEEEEVISAHRKEVEDTMEIVHEVCIHTPLCGAYLRTSCICILIMFGLFSLNEWKIGFELELRFSEVKLCSTVSVVW
jgi:hypothetical protein